MIINRKVTEFREMVKEKDLDLNDEKFQKFLQGSPLHYAIRHGREEFVEILVEDLKIDVVSKDYPFDGSVIDLLRYKYKNFRLYKYVLETLESEADFSTEFDNFYFKVLPVQ